MRNTEIKAKCAGQNHNTSVISKIQSDKNIVHRRFGKKEFSNVYIQST
jgi:adenylylsulfate kinase-like enzyme